ncbi:transposase [Gluconobacter thailandicus]|uniref:Transposase n=1 Tax=Gluconobacter thailandicus TaxID=257438 RepID=A0AAP9ET44_GLUTH|nr:transposase [Gluconobacter thailandicus]
MSLDFLGNEGACEGAEYLINDHSSFMRFLSLGLSGRVPDTKTMWLFRKRLPLTAAIDTTLRKARYQLM